MKEPMRVMESACVSLLRSVLCSPLLLTITVDLGAKGLKALSFVPRLSLATKGGKSEGFLFLVHETNVHTCVSYVVPPHSVPSPSQPFCSPGPQRPIFVFRFVRRWDVSGGQ